MQLRPLFDRIVCKMGEEKSESTIVKPDKYKQPSNEGIVLAIGPGRYELGHLIPMNVKVGDTVLIAEMRGVDFHIQGSDIVRIVEEGAVMAIVERSALVLES